MLIRQYCILNNIKTKDFIRNLTNERLKELKKRLEGMKNIDLWFYKTMFVYLYSIELFKYSFLLTKYMGRIVKFGKKIFICELKKVVVRGGRTIEKVFCKEIKNDQPKMPCDKAH